MTFAQVNPSNTLRTGLGLALCLNFLWINISEVFRYFVFIMPMMRDAFPDIAGVAPMNISVFLIWGVWDTILVLAATLIPWISFDRFGTSVRHAILAGTGVWATVFVILWLGLWNMNLTTLAIVGVALPLALIEMLGAAFIVMWSKKRAGTI
ncbi:MAG: hypothetical protein ABJ370_21885 [Paracoccaceae bacterium]